MRIPVDIVRHEKSRTLELVYDGGERALLPYEFLRVMSPSAEVQGHTPDEAVLQVGKRDVMITDLEFVGLYALRIVFSDGHSSGLYSWDYLEELARARDTLWENYLQELAAAGASRDPDDPANKRFEPKPKRKCSHGA